jgi:cell division protein FtsI/penicillin-binding protein 2
VAIGQGQVLVTPLQMVRAVAVLANGGRLVTPHLAARLESPDGSVVGPVAPIVDLGISPASLARVKDAMEAVVYEYGGTAHEKHPWGRIPARVYGKTGTAQTPRAWWPFEPPENVKQVTHQWFVGFAEPREGPPLAFAVVYHARGEGAAGETAARTAGTLLSWWFGR